MSFSIGDNLKAALKQVWDSKKFSGNIDKPRLHADLDENGHFQLEIEGKASAKMSADLPGSLDNMAVTAVNAAAELGNFAP